MLLIRNKTIRQFFGFVETANLLMLRLALANRRAVHPFPGIIFRNYMALRQDGPWRSLPFESIFPEFQGKRIVVEHLPNPGMFNPIEHLCYLALITGLFQPKVIFEIGTYRGRTALNFALNSPPDCEVYTLDLPPGSPQTAAHNVWDKNLVKRADPGADYRNKNDSEKITQLYGNSVSFDYTPYLARADIVFVDGGHDFQTVLSDTQNALRIARPGGVVVWDDFANYGDYNDVTRAVLRCVPAVQIAESQLAIYRVPTAAANAHEQPQAAD
jgi:predicted O-methyltransferase YrrM